MIDVPVFSDGTYRSRTHLCFYPLPFDGGVVYGPASSDSLVPGEHNLCVFQGCQTQRDVRAQSAPYGFSDEENCEEKTCRVDRTQYKTCSGVEEVTKV